MSADITGVSSSTAEQTTGQIKTLGRAEAFHARALIVDGHDDNLLLMEYALEALGLSFMSATCSHEAIQLAGQHQFSLVLLNVSLFGRTGISVLKHLRKQRRYRTTPIIAVTAMAFPKDRTRLLAAGFSDCLIKPYTLDDLDSLIHQYAPETP